ncbi:MAG TPA: DUF1003 domain-containing protein [Miltoncostaeaceae bacterium]|nr:DUF1003 domain-containing protein [Miltoncostaeaceae bacterium]
MPSSSPTAQKGSPGPDEPLGHRLHRLFVPVRLPPPVNPALLKHTQKRAEDAQNRVADRITTFAGSMTFVYIHILWFGCWIGFRVEHYPFGLLTMIVSLEAIFLSTFVMISQNRADAKRQVIADEQWRTVQEEDTQNQELLDLSRKIYKLTQEVHAVSSQVAAAGTGEAGPAGDAAPAGPGPS